MRAALPDSRLTGTADRRPEHQHRTVYAVSAVLCVLNLTSERSGPTPLKTSMVFITGTLLERHLAHHFACDTSQAHRSRNGFSSSDCPRPDLPCAAAQGACRHIPSSLSCIGSGPKQGPDDAAVADRITKSPKVT